MNNYSEEFNWGSFLCRITGIGTSDPKTKILIILCIVNIEGHRDRYIGSLFMEGSQPFIYRCAPRGTRTGTLVHSLGAMDLSL